MIYSDCSYQHSDPLADCKDGVSARSKEDICRGDSQSVTIPDLLLGYPLPKRPSEDSA